MHSYDFLKPPRNSDQAEINPNPTEIKPNEAESD